MRPGWSALENITLVGAKVRWGVFGFVAVFFGCLGDEGVGMVGAAVFFCFCFLFLWCLVVFLGVGFGVVFAVVFFLGGTRPLVEVSFFFGVRSWVREEEGAVVVGEGE